MYGSLSDFSMNSKAYTLILIIRLTFDCLDNHSHGLAHRQETFLALFSILNFAKHGRLKQAFCISNVNGSSLNFVYRDLRIFLEGLITHSYLLAFSKVFESRILKNKVFLFSTKNKKKWSLNFN